MTSRYCSTASGLALATLLLAGCSDGGSADTSARAEASPSASAASGPRLLALGDSSATGAGDADGGGWVQRYADLLEAETGQVLEVTNRASEGQKSDALAGQVESNQSLRDEIAAADYVVVGAGGADLNDGDDAWAAGTCSGPACYTAVLAGYEANIERVAAAVAELRAGEPTVLRAVTQPNGLTGAESVIPDFLRLKATEVGIFQARSNRESTCAALRGHGGQCIDVLTAFNGTGGEKNAYASGLMNLQDCCYASGKGRQRMAELLIATGIEPQALR